MELDRRKFYKLWLLFVVFATGLVWVWSLVGQRSQHAARVDGQPLELLRVEDGCVLSQGPCAAYAKTLALVASVKVDGDGLRWRLKALGAALPALAQLELELRRPERSPQTLQVVKVGDEWQAYSAGKVPPGTVLRARLQGGEQPWVADYPLTAVQ